jgi:hypothetical protein
MMNRVSISYPLMFLINLLMLLLTIAMTRPCFCGDFSLYKKIFIVNFEGIIQLIIF